MLNKYIFGGLQKSKISTRTVLISLITLLSFMFGKNAFAQPAVYTFAQPFSANIPGWPTPFAGANFRTPTVDWYQSKITGNGSAPNDFQWVNNATAGLYPVATNQDIAGFPAGAGFVRYINRAAAYPAVSGAVNGDAAFLASRSLDWSGHTAYTAATDTIGISVWRDGTAAVAGVLDYIQVWVNTTPSLTGATLALTTGGANSIPRSATQAPVAAVANAWNRYQFVIPNDPRFWAAGTGGTSSAYVIIAAYSLGGNNIFIDNINLPQWQTNMAVTSAQVFVIETADVGANTLNNMMLGVQITTKGSLTPRKIDGLLFSSAGSTAPTTDIVQPNNAGAKCWYTGGGTSFATTLGAIAIPKVNPSTPSYTNGNLFYGWLSATTGCPDATTPATVNFFPGNENFVWLAYDIAAGAVPGHNVAADFEQLFTSWTTLGCTGDTIITSSGIQTPASVGAFIPSPSASAIRQIDQAYNIPTYTQGTSWPSGGYYNNDFISVVDFPGDNSTKIENAYHDVTCTACIAVSGQNCNRFSCHPPDYKQFKPQNLGSYMNRGPLQVTQGFGVRKGGVGYLLRANCGTWFSSNTIGVFIDWNKDGDFDDRYGTGAGINAYIYENYGSKSQVNATMSTTPVTWNANSSWIIDVPMPTDAVADLNQGQACVTCALDVGPIIVGNVRMRIREIYAASSSAAGVIGVHPTTSGQTWGEVEDYTIQVLPDCPGIGSNVCKWVGASNDWNDPKNWCPALPTKNDIAYINTGPQNMPVILDNTVAECRTLKIMPGASLGINATKLSSLKVYDDVEIGSGATLGTGSRVAVTSNYNASITIPGRSVAPGTGIALPLTAPFRNQFQQKTQISYSASELANTYGWKLGDVVDQIGLEILAISPSSGSANYPNMRINAYFTSGATAVQFPFPVPAAPAKMAVMAGDANVVAGPILIYSNPAFNLNMLYGANGCNTGCANSGNYTLIPLIANSLIWDGVSHLVLSIEIWTQSGLTPGKIYIPGVEAGPTFSVLALNFTSVVGAANAAFQTGWNLSGNGQYRNSSTLAYTALGGINASVSNNRPRLDFIIRRPYNQFPITVGGDWINNNRFSRTYAYSTTPVYGIAGDSGFVASNSRVIFDPTGRNTVNSPGLNSANATYYPGIPGALLPADVDQEITSQSSGVANSSVFNVLQISKASATGKAVRQASAVTPLYTGHYADTLLLDIGELNLNRKEFTLRQPAATALVRTTGWLRSEDNVTVPLVGAAGQIQSKFKWKIGAGTTGTYLFPFKATGTAVFTFSYTKSVAADDVGDLTVATYGTPAWDNLPYPNNLPSSPVNVLTMTTNPTPVTDATPWTVDRFWFIKRSAVSPLTPGLAAGNLKFEYDNSVEGTLTSAYFGGEMKAQRYEMSGANPGWHAPYANQSDGQAAPVAFVNHEPQYIDANYNIWTIVHTNLLQAPLPLSITNFTGKQMDQRVKLWWDVQSESGVKTYEIERTVDHNSYDFIGSKTPVGPSNATLNYEVWDNKPLKGTQYYRLASLNDDGSTKYYGPISVNFGSEGLFDITNVTANINSTSIKVDFNYDSNLPYSYLITDIVGNIVAKGDNNKATEGENSIVINANLSQGIYVITLINSDKSVSRKMVY